VPAARAERQVLLLLFAFQSYVVAVCTCSVIRPRSTPWMPLALSSAYRRPVVFRYSLATCPWKPITR